MGEEGPARVQDKALVAPVRLAQQACPRQLLACPAAAGAASVAPLSRRMHWCDKLYGENKLPTRLNLKYYLKRLKIKKSSESHDGTGKTNSQQKRSPLGICTAPKLF